MGNAWYGYNNLSASTSMYDSQVTNDFLQQI